MTTFEAADYLGVNASRVRQLVRAGLLEAEREETRRGPVLWFTQPNLDAYRKLVAESQREGKRGRPSKIKPPDSPGGTSGTPGSSE